MRLLFGQAYFLRFDAKLWEAMQPYPPLGTLYAASVAREAGHDVTLFDAMLADSEDEWAAALDRDRPDLAIIYEDNFNYLSKMCLLRMRQAGYTMIDMARDRGVPVVVAGSDASDHSQAYLERGADYVLLGEGEETLAELLAALETDSVAQTRTIVGLAYARRDDRGRLAGWESNGRRPDIKDLDRLPFPAWDLVDVARYRTIWKERHGRFSMNMVTTRGCPYHCNWCAKPIWGQRYNSRSPQNVVAEMAWLVERYQPDHIWFADDIMGLRPGWLESFAAELDAAGVRLPFKCLSRADLLLRGDTIDALARAGCEIVWIGAESGSQQVLDAMEKGTRVDQIVEATRRIHAAGFRIGFFLQFGYPGETLDDVMATLALVRACRPDDIGMSVSYPLPGTPFYERVRDQLGLKRHWVDSADLEMLYHGPFSSDFYRQLHVVLHKEFRSRRSRARLSRLVRGRARPHREDWRRFAAMVYQAATLPLARRRLTRLARTPERALPALPPGMDREAAATPTPQT